MAAVRTERHFVGFDTDASYVALADRRVAEERASGPVSRRVTVAPGRASTAVAGPGSEDRAVAGGHKARDIAQGALEAAGFTDIERGVAYGDLGVGVDFRARDAAGGLWLFELSGAYSATRPGLRRPDVLFRALGKSAVLHQARLAEPTRTDLGPLVLLSTDRPAARSAGAKALTIARSPDGAGPVHDVVELLDAASMERLAATRLEPEAYGSSGTGRPLILCRMTGPRSPSSGRHSAPSRSTTRSARSAPDLASSVSGPRSGSTSTRSWPRDGSPPS